MPAKLSSRRRWLPKTRPSGPSSASVHHVSPFLNICRANVSLSPPQQVAPAAARQSCRSSAEVAMMPCAASR